MSKQTLSGLDRDIHQVLGRTIQEAFSDGMVANFAFTTGSAVAWNFTDTFTVGTGKGLAISYTCATNRSSGDARAVDIGLAVTGNCTNAYGLKMYTGGCGSATIGSLNAISIYMDDIGGSATVSNKHCLDLNIDNTNNASSICSFIRVYGHGGPVDSVIYLANNGGNQITNLLQFSAGVEPYSAGAPSDMTADGKIRCQFGPLVKYIALYNA